ncbi:MAG TPA: hypothetical protein VIE86_02010 [Nitrososphaera sp.]
MRRDERYWQLKESAKWSLEVDERRRAIRELVSGYGMDAIQAIEEVKDVSAYDEIKRACIEAIKSAKNAHSPVMHRKKKKSRKASAKRKSKRK